MIPHAQRCDIDAHEILVKGGERADVAAPSAGE
jgi:hypothetical protein